MCTLHHTTLHCLLIIYFSGIKLYLVRLGNCFKVPGCKRDWVDRCRVDRPIQLVSRVSQSVKSVRSVNQSGLE